MPNMNVRLFVDYFMKKPIKLENEVLQYITYSNQGRNRSFPLLTDHGVSSLIFDSGVCK